MNFKLSMRDEEVQAAHEEAHSKDEEILEPWVHYRPLADYLSDVEEKMQWVIDNDEEAREIAHRGKLWISDLVFHPDADNDEELIFDKNSTSLQRTLFAKFDATAIFN
jgi:hypothetical protein